MTQSLHAFPFYSTALGHILQEHQNNNIDEVAYRITLFGCTLFHLMQQSFVTTPQPQGMEETDFPYVVPCYDHTCGERSAVVECLTRDRAAAGSSVTVLCLEHEH